MAKSFKPVAPKTNLGTYPFGTVVFSTSMALFIMGLFGIITVYSWGLTEIIKNNFEIQVYLNKDISESEKQYILKTIQTRPYLNQKDEVVNIRYQSKEEASRKFIEETGEQFVKFLGENPLRDAYILKIQEDYSNAESLAQIKNDLEGVPGIFEVEYVESLIDQVNKNISKISFSLLSFAIILVVVAILLVSNAIRLAMFSQRFLIRSMQLVGADPWFIQKPYIIRAALQGVLSGFIASLMLAMLLQYAYAYIPDLKYLQRAEMIIAILGMLIITGGALGAICARSAVNKFLQLTLDQLY